MMFKVTIHALELNINIVVTQFSQIIYSDDKKELLVSTNIIFSSNITMTIYHITSIIMLLMSY